jgi:hypothetical protein
MQETILLNLRRSVAFKNDLRLRRTVLVPLSQVSYLRQVVIPAVIRQPCHLKSLVAFHHAVSVVVNGFAWARKQAGGRIIVSQDEAGISLTALQGDAHGHLVNCAAREAIGASQSLRTEQDMQAKGASLSHQAVQNLRGLRANGVVFGEKFLELVYQQENARQPVIGLLPIVGNVIHTSGAEEVAATFEFSVQPL